MNPEDDHHSAPAPLLVPRSSLPRIEFGRNQERDFLFGVTELLAAVVSWLTWLFPRFFVNMIALGIGRLSWRMSDGFRACVESNLAHVNDLPEDHPTVQKMTRTVFDTNALNVADLLEAPHLSEKKLISKLKIAEGSWTTLDDALAAGRGAVLLTAHVGSFDLVGAALSARGYPLTVLTARTTNRYAFDAVTFLRTSHNMNVVQTTSSGVREAYRALKRGEFVILLSDRDFFLSGKDVVFFGESTTLPTGAVRFARDTGAPIIPIFTRRTGADSIIDILPPFSIPKTNDRNEDVALAMNYVSEALMIGIGKAPDQWALFQRVWPEEST